MVYIGYRHMDTITLEVHPPYLPREDIRASANAQWALTDLVNMAKYLETHVPGDGNKYKIPVLKSLTEYLNDRVVIGGLKAEGSEAKIIRRTGHLQGCQLPQTRSGSNWDDDFGANIITQTA
ncbi:hypothetical protein B0H14DRAFT_2345738 [Mycena olivaceomarginata]|nr:hypothetical protein B0H14DRAFT_2345738 [Mycena olivaceomarginata]